MTSSERWGGFDNEPWWHDDEDDNAFNILVGCAVFCAVLALVVLLVLGVR